MDFKMKNFTMDSFNNNVNNSGNVQTKYENWAQYRQHINRFISRSVKDTGNIIVLGAGECNDLDLHFLTSIFDMITLSDVDTKSIDDGVVRQKLDAEQMQKINIVQADYTALGRVGFFDEIAELAKNNADSSMICKYITKTIGGATTNDILLEYKKSSDVVLVCPTYTQLAYTQMEVLLKIFYEHNVYPIEKLNKILTTMHNMMPTITKKYNSLILSLTKDNGIVFSLVDIAEITDTSVIQQLTSNITDFEYINKFLLNKGLDFGKIGRDDLKNRVKMIDEEFVIWPFNDEKQYLVCLTACDASRFE